MRLAQHSFGDSAENQMAPARGAVGGDDDQVNAFLLGGQLDFGGGAAQLDQGAHRDAAGVVARHELGELFLGGVQSLPLEIGNGAYLVTRLAAQRRQNMQHQKLRPEVPRHLAASFQSHAGSLAEIGRAENALKR